MAINKKLIHFKKYSDFIGSSGTNGTTLPTNGYYHNIPENAIVFILDTKLIWTHGTLYDGGTVDPGNIEDSILSILDTKLDNISDLDTIRSGAALGATALQALDLNNYALSVSGQINNINSSMNSVSSEVSNIKRIAEDARTKAANNESAISQCATKHELNTAASTYLTKTDAATTYLGKTAKAVSATTADSATKATQDASGNTITSTYATKDFVKSAFFLEITYAELKQLVDTGSLIPGKFYGINDYSCIYILQYTNLEMEVPAPDIKYIICEALTNSILSEDVTVIREEGYVLIIECKYDINPENVPYTKGMTTLKPKGVIYYMMDAYGNALPYDFKHVKFRRYAITDILPNMEEDTGSGTTAGRYKVYATDTCYSWKDGRRRVGSGEQTDAVMIPKIYDGTWPGCTPEMATQVGLVSQAYAANHKPYQNSNNPWDKYLSWYSDTKYSFGLGRYVSEGPCNVSGLSNVIVDANDYKDLYTFDYMGTDASERLRYNSTIPLVRNVEIVRNTREAKNLGSLPATVFIFSNGVINSSSTYIQNVYFDAAPLNTILLMPSLGYSSAFIDHFLGKGASILGNLICTLGIRDLTVTGLMFYNYICGGIIECTIGMTFTDNVIFGYINKCKMNGFTYNLWYNMFPYYQLEGGSITSPPDGSYSYDSYFSPFIMANILGPFQYSHFDSHVNTNTFRGIYNKGVKIGSANQLNSYGILRWGVELGYAIGLGIKFGNLEHGVTIPSNTFGNTYRYSSNNEELFDNTKPAIPSMRAVSISGHKADAFKIANLPLSSLDLLNFLSDLTDKSEKLLYLRNGEWFLDVKGSKSEPLVDHGTSDTTFALTPNILHKWGTVTSLALTLAAPENVGVINEYMFEFVSGTTATSLSLPSTVKWVSAPSIETNKIYQCSIVNNVGIIAAATNV